MLILQEKITVIEKGKFRFYFRTGFSQFGSVFAFLLSWTTNHSLLWGILHSCLGWPYITYWLVTYSNIEEVILTWMHH